MGGVIWQHNWLKLKLKAFAVSVAVTSGFRRTSTKSLEYALSAKAHIGIFLERDKICRIFSDPQKTLEMKQYKIYFAGLMECVSVLIFVTIIKVANAIAL